VERGTMDCFVKEPKPPFPSVGRELECPNCAGKSTYKVTDLTYQA
jgi:hypothetical protein